jgi:tight adherence protein C
MMLGALCAGMACFVGLLGLFRAAPSSASGPGLIRATTLSPLEWRTHQRRQEGWYQRWLRPVALLWGSRLHLRPVRIDPMYLIQAGLDPIHLDGVEFRVIRLMSGLGAAVTAVLLTLVISAGWLVVPLLAFAGYIAPVRFLARRRHRRQRQMERELPQVVGMLRAFTVAGMPIERGLHLLSSNMAPPSILGQEIRLALGRYGLGVSIEEALQEIGLRTGIDDVTSFVAALAQSKRLGSGLEATLRDQELMVRMNARNRATARAASVSTKLLGVLGAVYLPEFVILIIVPLFWGIMRQAFG